MRSFIRLASKNYRMMLLSAAIALGASQAHAGFTTVNPAPASEAGHAAILGNAYGGSFSALSDGLSFSNGTITASRVDDAANKGPFAPVSFDARALAAFSSATQSFGIYSGGVFSTLFTLTGTGFNATGSGQGAPIASFEFARTGAGAQYRSDEAGNPDGADHIVTYAITGLGDGKMTRVMFFEDSKAPKGDFDFNDMVIEVSRPDPSAAPALAIPLPPAVWTGLCSLGVVALVGARRLGRMFS